MRKNMFKDGISLIFITYNRKKELEYTLDLFSNIECDHNWEIVVVDQGSSDGTELIFKDSFTNIVKYHRLEENVGVAKGRNIGAAVASYEFMVFLDDDANFVSDSALNEIYDCMQGSIYNMFAFKVSNLDGGLYNWPYGSKKKHMSNERFIAKYFIGCGHAIKKTFFNSVGGYSDELFFWGEETELVLKSLTIDAHAVQYDGAIEVIHRVSGNGRNSDAGRYYYKVRNRLFIIKNIFPKLALPIYYYYKYGYYFKALKKGWVKEYRRGLLDSQNMKTNRRYVIGFRQLLRYLML